MGTGLLSIHFPIPIGLTNPFIGMTKNWKRSLTASRIQILVLGSGNSEMPNMLANRPGPCGCRIHYNTLLPDPPKIVYCPTHAAAPTMVSLLTGLADDFEASSIAGAVRVATIRQAARALLKEIER